jgi:hypothetical protein
VKRTNDQYVNTVLEVAERLADESDYEDNLAPKLTELLNYLYETYPNLEWVDDKKEA